MSWACELTEETEHDLRNPPKAISEARGARTHLRMGWSTGLGRLWQQLEQLVWNLYS